MRKFYKIAAILLMVIANQTKAQTGFSFSCARDTIINGCASGCITLKTKIPDIRSSTSNYVVNPMSAAGGCFVPYVSPNTPGNPSGITIDDKYSPVIPLPFQFPFYGTNYPSLLANSNGFVSFDISKANQITHYGILNSGGALTAASGNGYPGENLPSALYDKALIMGPYHDLDPAYTTSPTQLIKYDVLGSAPHRRWILSFYRVPLFTDFGGNCDLLIENTHQIVLYESLGIIEVFLNDMQQCATWNDGRSMVGLQNFTRNQGIMAPGRAANDPVWGNVGMNESWRFVPAAGPTLYNKVELYTLGGTLVSTGDTTSIGNSTFEVGFPNVCPTGPTTYVIKSTYNNPQIPGTFVYGTDTVNVSFANPLSAVATPVAADCANHYIGSVTVAVSGYPGPYEYSIDGGATWQLSPTFNEPAGDYTVLYRKLGNTCGGTIVTNIPLVPNGIASSYVPTNVKCNGGNTGTIVVTPTGGTIPYQFSKDGGANFQLSGTFNGLTAGPYTIRIQDALGCYKDTVINVTEPSTITAALSGITNATCTLDGTITVEAGGGTPGYSYSTDGINFQTPSPVLIVTNGTYTVTVKDANGCIKTLNGVVVPLTNDLLLQSRIDTTVCLGATVRLNTTGNAATYTWIGDPGLDDPSSASPLATPATIPLTRYIVIGDLGQCQKKDTVDITVITTVTVDAGQNVTILAGDHTTLFGTVTNATSYLWTSNPIGNTLSSTTSLGPVATPTVTTTYTLTATNSLGCFASDDVVVTVLPVCVDVRNAFTPNGDGDHDFWQVYRQRDCFKAVSVHVFNRYGSKVFESKDYFNDWDGRYKGKPLPDGTYYGVIEFSLITGETYRAKTDLTILR